MLLWLLATFVNCLATSIVAVILVVGQQLFCLLCCLADHVGVELETSGGRSLSLSRMIERVKIRAGSAAGGWYNSEGCAEEESSRSLDPRAWADPL